MQMKNFDESTFWNTTIHFYAKKSPEKFLGDLGFGSGQSF